MGQHLSIDRSICIGCGLCAKVCIRDNIAVSEVAEETGGDCFDCGQCEAVCPKDAIRVLAFGGREPVPYDPGEGTVSYQQMAQLLSRRRSCRLFVGGGVGEDEVSMLMEAVRNSPTANNSRDVEYAVVSERLPEFLRHLAEVLRPESRRFLRIAQFCSMEDPGRLGRHPLVWDGEVLFLAFSDIPTDAAVAMARVELAAYTMGLGGFYSRWVQMADDVDHDKLMEFFPEVPKTKRLHCAFVVGRPSVKYRRTVPREDPVVHRYRLEKVKMGARRPPVSGLRTSAGACRTCRPSPGRRTGTCSRPCPGSSWS